MVLYVALHHSGRELGLQSPVNYNVLFNPGLELTTHEAPILSARTTVNKLVEELAERGVAASSFWSEKQQAAEVSSVLNTVLYFGQGIFTVAHLYFEGRPTKFGKNFAPRWFTWRNEVVYGSISPIQQVSLVDGELIQSQCKGVDPWISRLANTFLAKRYNVGNVMWTRDNNLGFVGVVVPKLDLERIVAQRDDMSTLAREEAQYWVGRKSA